MKKILLSVFFCLIFITASAQSYFAYVDSAEVHINNKEWKKAEDAIIGALRLEPSNFNNSLLLSNLATIQRNQGRNKEALNNYSAAINMTPNAVTLIKNRGVLYLEIDSISRAERDFKRVIELEPNDTESLYYYGMIMLGKGDREESKKCFNAILKIDPKSSEGKEGMARWYQLMGNYNEAISIYTTLIKNEVTEAHLIHRAECYLERKMLPEASVDINDAIKINPTEGYLYYLKARLNLLRYQKDEAVKNGELAVKYGVKKEAVDKLILDK